MQKQISERLELLKKEAAKQEETKEEEKPSVGIYIVGADGAEDVTEALKAFVEFMKGIADDND